MKHPHESFRTSVALGSVCMVTLCGGCQWKIESDKGGPPQTRPASAWQFSPVSMRIYPSTRFDIDQNLLEAQIEFFDQMNDSIKAIGHLRLGLFKPGRTGADSVGRLMYTWDVAMLTLEDQRSHYNTITKAYSFQLKVDHFPRKLNRTVLHAAFRGRDGTRLEVTEPVPVKRDGSKGDLDAK